jgi:2-succinyl-5-enolpyruvyl-6-hydroxy-3-cyclohexene-1-carboxylate synthase
MSASRSSEAHLIGEWARLLACTLREAGVRDIWVSPGSRSTPFTWVFEQTEGLTLRPVVDERSAAFLALGHTRITGRPCALLCTSGTAAANYFPAVVEASLAHLPLILLTADRPLEVQHAGAAQAIDQIELYGDHARAFFDLGLPDAAPTALRGLQRSVAQAVALARGPLPGPVHLNLRARKPLEPAAPQTDGERALSAHVTTLVERPLAHHAPSTALANEAVLAAARTLSEAASGVIVVGPLPAFSAHLAEPIAELSTLLGFPIFAEAASQLRFPRSERCYPLFDWLLSSPPIAARVQPDVLLCLGATPTSSAFERWAARASERIVLADHFAPDPIGNATLLAAGSLAHSLPALVTALRAVHGKDPSGREEARRARDALERTLGEAQARAVELVERALREAGPTAEGAVVRSVVEALPEGAVLVLGNSLPIRDVEAYVTNAPRLSVVSQRGANGIDGLVSGAIGSAIASGAPTLLLVGDVSLLHDLGALASSGLVTSPLVIAVVDNDGGRIFDQLPASELYAGTAAERLWRTPPSLELSHAAALFGLGYAAPAGLAEIRQATQVALEKRGVTLLHLRVAPESAATVRRRVLAELSSE